MFIPRLQCDEAKKTYFEEYIATMKREWNGIDRLRMDKYYSLFRYMVLKCFQYLKSKAWEQSNFL